MTIDGELATQQTCTLKADVAPTAGASQAPSRDGVNSLLVKRDYDICQAPCERFCNAGSGGPNPYGANSLFDVLLLGLTYRGLHNRLSNHCRVCDIKIMQHLILNISL